MTDRGRLQGKTAIITGAASGIGEAAALLFAREGAKLTLADMNAEGLEKVAKQVKDSGGEVVTRVTNVGKEEEVKALVDLTLETYSQVDILVNNAGIAMGTIDPRNQTREEWEKVFKVNVMGAVFAMKHLTAHFQERKCGAVVNTSSVAGMRAGAGGNAYSASKAALISLTQTSACDFGEYGVRVNAVCPGLIETGMTRMVFDYARKQGKEDRLGYRCELRRAGRSEEVAAAILFLASDEASYITGQALPVDGGNTASLNLPGMKY